MGIGKTNSSISAYIHPISHPPSIIEQDASNRFVTDAEKITWNNKTANSAYTSTPAMDGTASAGSNANYSRGDHVHPTDTTRQAAPTVLTSLPTSGTALTNNAEYIVTNTVGTYQFVPPTGNHKVWLRFTTSSSPSITFSGITGYANEAPTFAASTTYEMTIVHGYVAVVKLVSA